MKDKFDEIFEESGLQYEKKVDMFKTRYFCQNIVVEADQSSATIFDGSSYYSAPIKDENLYTYLRDILCRVNK